MGKLGLINNPGTAITSTSHINVLDPVQAALLAYSDGLMELDWLSSFWLLTSTPESNPSPLQLI